MDLIGAGQVQSQRVIPRAGTVESLEYPSQGLSCCMKQFIVTVPLSQITLIERLNHCHLVAVVQHGTNPSKDLPSKRCSAQNSLFPEGMSRNSSNCCSLSVRERPGVWPARATALISRDRWYRMKLPNSNDIIFGLCRACVMGWYQAAL